jgi:RNA polymerase sigma-70 factor, ECF subfamily
MPDEALFIKRLQAGDNIAFQELISEFAPRLLRAARLLITNTAEADELVCDTLAESFCCIRNFKQQSTLFTWLYGILLNKFYYRLRHIKRDSSLKNYLPSAEVVSHARGFFDRQELSDLLSHLSPEQREIILLKYLEGMKFKEISRALDIPENTVKTRLHRGMEKLRKIIK